jgi:ubiquinol-cytochrome c reductase cytochrome c1 subunit
MIRKLTITALATLALSAGGAMAAGEKGKVTDYAFSFEGPFGTYDRQQLQRGLQVYTEVCAACHGLQYVPIRTLGDAGGPELPMDQVRAYAADVLPPIFDAEIDDERPRALTDHFPHSALETAPDLSLMAKARVGFSGPAGLGINQLLRGIGGPEYIASMLTYYTGEEKEEAGATYYENETFSGGWIAMPNVLSDDGVEYADGTRATVAQQAQDVAAFLMWTAEPKMGARKEAGFTAVIFLTILTVLLYLTNKKIWAGIKRRKQA